MEPMHTEALRKYPSVPFLNRMCVDDYKIPGSNFTIPKGMRVVISVSGLQGNPKYYPDPEKFDPERFTKENIAQRNSYVNLGFGDGPRHCIGKENDMKLSPKIALFGHFYKPSNSVPL